MIAAVALLVVAVVCAFMIGVSVNQGGTCAVTAAKELVLERRFRLFRGFAITTGAAGLVCLPLTWIASGAVHVAARPEIAPGLLFGAVLLGVGAVINDACLFGTLSRIGRGELRFLALPVGLWLGFAISLHAPGPISQINPLAEVSAVGVVVVIAFGLLLVLAWRLSARTDPGTGRWELRHAMATLGVCGALLFVISPGWSYAEILRHSLAPRSATMMSDWGGAVAAVAALAGAVVAGVRSKSFHYRKIEIWDVFRSLAGGAIMAVGAGMGPGGNDRLLLFSLPSATPGGFAAYVVMSITVITLLAAGRHLSRVRH